MNDDLAAFQALLLKVLATETDGETIRARLLEAPAAAPYRDWVLACEARMLAVGAELVATWARREPPV